MFILSFLASCQYVTTVFATHQFEPEVVAFRPGYFGADGNYREIYSSGGGFSNYFGRPKYQDKVVSSYVRKLNRLYNGLYNKKGRANPDIAAQGRYFAYVWNGTSGSTPLVAGWAY
jgi:tripeptidyl-peptidase-1